MARPAVFQRFALSSGVWFGGGTQIERGEVGAEVSSLFEIATALRVPLTGLLAGY
jgi:transcriptional regulator with XRE-family HTH domain